MPIYTKNINIWVPCNCYKMKTLTRVRTCQNFGNGLLKSDLTFGYLTCSVQSKKISLIHPTVLYSAKSENYISENPKIRIQRRVTVDSTLYGTAQSWITLSPGPEQNCERVLEQGCAASAKLEVELELNQRLRQSYDSVSGPKKREVIGGLNQLNWT